jgi:hypothetical protein
MTNWTRSKEEVEVGVWVLNSDNSALNWEIKSVVVVMVAEEPHEL